MACVEQEAGQPILTDGCPTIQYYYDKPSETILAWEPDPQTVAYESVTEGDGTIVMDRDVHTWILNQLSKISFSLIDLVDLTTLVLHPGLNGSFVCPDPNIIVVFIDNIIPDPMTNIWYPPSSFAKYGLFGWGTGPVEMPMLFVNLSPCRFIRPINLPVQGFVTVTAGVTVYDAFSYQPLNCPQPQYSGSYLGVPT